MKENTGRHHAIPPPAPARKLRKKPSPLPWRRAECDFSDEPTEVRRVAEPVARAVRQHLEQPWYTRLAVSVAITLAAAASAWAANALMSGSTADAVHTTQIGDLWKRLDRVEDKVDQVLEELRRER